MLLGPKYASDIILFIAIVFSFPDYTSCTEVEKFFFVVVAAVVTDKYGNNVTNCHFKKWFNASLIVNPI